MAEREKELSGGLDPRVVRVLLERERIILAARLLPGVVHNLSGAVQTLSLPLDLARLALKGGDAAKAGDKLDSLRQGLERLTFEVGLMAQRSLRDHRETAEPLDLYQMARDEMAFWRGDLFVKHDLALESGLPDDPGLVKAAPADAALAFNLVLANAVEAVRSGPSPWIKVSGHEREGRRCLWVSDSGPGPSEEMAAHLFQPFQGDKGGKHHGLGLFLAAKALEPWGGRVAWLPGEPRNTFEICLPRP